MQYRTDTVKALDMGYAAVFTTLEELIIDLKTEQIITKSSRRMKNIRKASLIVIDEVGFLPLSTQEIHHPVTCTLSGEGLLVHFT